MRVAALYDVHGNAAALDALLAEVAESGADTLVFGGDVALGPFPAETLDRLANLALPARFVRGNCDRELVAAFDAGPVETQPPEESWEAVFPWAAGRMSPEQRDLLAGFEPSVTLTIDGLGPTLFCHATPRSDEEIVTRLTPPAVLESTFEGIREATVVVGHTHVQFELDVAGIRLVNAGSVGMPYADAPGAYWALLGPDVTCDAPSTTSRPQPRRSDGATFPFGISPTKTCSACRVRRRRKPGSSSAAPRSAPRPDHASWDAEGSRQPATLGGLPCPNPHKAAQADQPSRRRAVRLRARFPHCPSLHWPRGVADVSD